MKKIYLWSLFLISGMSFSTSAQASFKDVTENEPYFKAITYLEEKGILEGYQDGNFLPNQLVNRVEALKIALLGSGISVPQITQQNIFADVLWDSWYGSYVSKGKSLGIVSGDGKTGLYRPGDPVQLDEILKILINTKGVKVTPPQFDPYVDVPVDSWSAPYFDYAKSQGLFALSEGQNINPAQKITRGMMANLMYQLDTKPRGYQEGVASYYGGRAQTNGETGFTAAHPTLPFGTKVLVRNLSNNKTVIVTINDRGPYADGRIIDLSTGAFQTIGSLSQGVIKVSIIPLDAQGNLSEREPDCSEAQKLNYISKDSFENISLNQDIPTRFTANETLHLSGTSASSSPGVTAFVINSQGQQFPFYTQKNASGAFSVQVFFPGSGNYKVGILAGESGSGSAYPVNVLASTCLKEQTDGTLPLLSELNFKLKNGNTVVSWKDSNNYKLTKVSFSQNNHHQDYIVYDEDQFIPHYADFQGWDEGFITVEIAGANLSDPSILTSNDLRWSPVTGAKFMATTHHEYQVEDDQVIALKLPETIRLGSPMEFEVDPLVNLRKEGLVILPNGQVDTKILTSQTHDPLVNDDGISIFPSTDNDLKMSFTPQTNQTHFIELNNEQGIAALNIPIYPENIYPLLPNPVDLNPVEEALSSDLKQVQNQMLALVNQDRSVYGLTPVKLDPKLNELAQSRTDDMVKRSYLSHWNPEGLNANDLRKNHTITQYVSENIARDSGLTLAEYGLMRSALHRTNILDPEWKRAGFGVTKDPEHGGYIFVQIFSDDPIDFANLEQLRTRILTAVNAERGSDLQMDSTLNAVAQSWSEKMVKDNYFNFTDPNGDTLVDAMRDNGVSGILGTYIVGNSSFDAALEKIKTNPQVLESRWKKLGIGIKQDDVGIIKFTLTYTE